MLFSLSMFPIGDGSSVCRPVADVIEEIDRAGLRYEVTGMDTVIEGEWNDVVPVIRRAEERLRARHDRVFMLLTMDDHVGVQNRLRGAVEDVERELGRRVAH
ncbi:MAG TPA: MTH1187 family thiamine-binding protein [Gemmatimonadaceae bacterium]|nr:MTH1187 family thiamine-binding protein [Gemmatimonadaceae bacterium]